MWSVPDRSTRPGTPTPIAAGVGVERGRQLEQGVDEPRAAVRGGDATLGHDRRWARVDRPRHPSTLVPPTSNPTDSTPTACPQAAPALVPEQGSDPSEHVEVGVADADRHRDALGERLLDGVLDDVARPAPSSHRCRGGWVRPRPGHRRGPASPPGRSPWTPPGARHDAARAPPACRPARPTPRRPVAAASLRRSTRAASRVRSTSASTTSAAASTSAGDGARRPPGTRPHKRARRYGWSACSSSPAMASGAPIARWWKPRACHRSKAARAAFRRCWWASSSRWCAGVPRSRSPRLS